MNSIEIEALKLKNYKIMSQYSRTSTVGGGVMILVRTSTIAKEIKLPSVRTLTKDKEFECCLVEVKTSRDPLIIVGIYRTPKTCYEKPFLNNLDTLMVILNKLYKNILIIGDINIDVLEVSNKYKNFTSILESNQMNYLVDFPTRYSDQRDSALDNVITNINKANIKVAGIVTLLSDHDAQLIEIIGIKTKNSSTLKNSNNITKYSRKFNNENIHMFLNKLATESWMDV